MKNIGHLRNIDDSELSLMLTWRNAPSVRANMYTQHEISLKEHLSWWADTFQRDDQRYFMYEYLNAPSGIVAFTKIDAGNSNGSWAFFASPEAAKGTGTRMEFLALDYAFQTLQLHKLYCEVLAFNASVINLHKKFGFLVEGVFRQQYRKEAQFVDIHRLGLLAKEWEMRRPKIVQRLTAIKK